MKLAVIALSVLCATVTASPSVTKQVGFTGLLSRETALEAGRAVTEFTRAIGNARPEAHAPQGCANALIFDFGEPVAESGVLSGAQFVDVCNSETVVVRKGDAAADTYFKLGHEKIKLIVSQLIGTSAVWKRVQPDNSAPSTPPPSSPSPSSATSSAPPSPPSPTPYSNTFSFAVGRPGGPGHDHSVMLPGGSPTNCAALEQALKSSGLSVASATATSKVRAVILDWNGPEGAAKDALFFREEKDAGGKVCFKSKKGAIRATEDCKSTSVEAAVAAVVNIHSSDAAAKANGVLTGSGAFITGNTVCPTAFAMTNAHHLRH